MSQTYNPLLQDYQLRRMRLGSPLRAPDLGTAMVLERAVGEPLVVEHGERVPESRLGNYRRVCLIDVGNRGLSFAIHAASADPAFLFTAEVRFACRVIDPVTIARDKITDMTAALMPSLSAIVRETAARFDVLDANAAAQAIAARLNSAHPSPVMQLGSYSVQMTMVDSEQFVTTQRKIRVQKMNREAMQPIASGTREDMLAHIMAIDESNPMAMLDRERADREAQTRARLDALRAMMGAKMEDFDASQVRKQVLNQFFPDETTAIPGKRPGARERLSAKPPATLEEGAVVEGNVPRGEAAGGPEENAAQPEANGKPPNVNGASRLRGSLGRRPSQDSR